MADNKIEVKDLHFESDGELVERKDTDMYLIAAYIAYGARLLRSKVEDVAYGRKLLVVEGDDLVGLALLLGERIELLFVAVAQAHQAARGVQQLLIVLEQFLIELAVHPVGEAAIFQQLLRRGDDLLFRREEVVRRHQPAIFSRWNLAFSRSSPNSSPSSCMVSSSLS